MRKRLALSAALFIAALSCFAQAQAPNVRAVIFPSMPPAPTAAALVTWSPTDKTSNITLSGGNLVATDSNGAVVEGIRATNSIGTSKKYYMEFSVTTAAGANYIGFCNSSFTLGTTLNSSTNAIGFRNDGQYLINFATPAGDGPGFVWTTGDLIGVAVDGVNKKLWWRKNGGNWNSNVTDNPSTNVGGTDISTLTFPLFPSFNADTAGAVITVNFTTGTPPSGYVQWGN